MLIVDAPTLLEVILAEKDTDQAEILIQGHPSITVLDHLWVINDEFQKAASTSPDSRVGLD